MANLTFRYSIEDDNEVIWLSGTDYVGIRGGTVDHGLILDPNGEGPIQAQVTDSALTGGNARGDFATDWQRTRTITNQVASGDYSTIGGGRNNRAAGGSSVIAGGNLNIVNAPNSAVLGGTQNQANATASFSVVGGGAVNHILGSLDAGILGGRLNLIQSASTASAIGGGNGNEITGSTHAVISGGEDNLISGSYYSTIAGGEAGVISSSEYAQIVGGSSNRIESNSVWSSIIGGDDNLIRNTSVRSLIIGGGDNEIDGGTQNGILGSFSSTTTGIRAFVIGGISSQATARHTIAQGDWAHANHPTEVAFGGSPFGWGLGAAQRSHVVWAGTTQNATALNLGLGNSASEEFLVQQNTMYTFHISVAARAVDGGLGAKWWHFSGGLFREAGNVFLIPNTVIYTGDTAGTAASWVCVVESDAGAGTNLRIRVTGEASREIRWVATGYLTKVMIPTT